MLYITRNTKSFERNYESTEREMACTVWVFVKLRHLLEGSKTVLVTTDHASIREIVLTSAPIQYSTRINKFRKLLAPFIDDIQVFYRPGKDLVNVDPLSRTEFVAHSTDVSNVESIATNNNR